MDRKSLSHFALGLLLGSLLTTLAFTFVMRSGRASAAGGGGDAAVVLKFAHSLDQYHPVHAAIMHFSERTAAISGGRLRVQVFPNGQLGSETECIEQVQRGALAMVKTSTAALEGFIPEMAAMGVPYVFRDGDHFWRVLKGPVGRELLLSGTKLGIHGLCYYDAGARSFYTVSRPVLKPEDVRELKIRVQASRIARDLIITLGGGPTPIPWGELYTALQQSMVDGAENNPPSYLSSRHYEVAKHYSLNEHTRVPDMVIFSEKVWSGLTPEQQGWINQAAEESVEFQRRLWSEKTAEALATVQKAGVTVHRPDTAEFARACEPLIREYENSPIGGLIRRIRETP